MAYRYLYSEKPFSSFKYDQSEEYKNFKNNLSKISILLTISEKCNNNTITFGAEDKRLYSDMKRTVYFDCPNVQFEEMKDDLYQVLIEQSIVLLITSWECYFSDVIENIFNDDLFIQKALTDEITFRDFLKFFKAGKKYEDSVISNSGSTNNLNFGTVLFESKKVSCQRLNDVKYIFQTYFNYINLEDIEKENWTDIEKFFDSRHSIIHNQHEDILSTYNKDKILNISESIYNIITRVDHDLFVLYNGEILEFE